MVKSLMIGIWLGLICSSVVYSIELPVVIPAQTQGMVVDRIDRGTRAFAWGSMGALYALFAVAAERLGEKCVSVVQSKLPKSICCVAPAIGVAGSLGLTSWLFVKYRELVWYANAVLYSRARLSPYIAHEILDDLRSYVRYLEALKNMQLEMEVLLAEVVKQRTLLNAGDLAKKIGQVVQEGELYVRNVCRRLEQLGLYEIEGLESFVVLAEEVDYAILQRGTEALHNSLELDAEVFDRLVADLLSYWQAYLEGLMSTIEEKMTLCQRVLSFEQMLSRILKTPLQAPVIQV